MRSRILAVPLLLLTLECLMAAPAPSQIGGLVRRAKAAANTATPTSESAAPDIKPEDRLTASGLDAFARGLDAEVAFRDSASRHRTPVKSPEAYSQCGATIATSPEFQRIQATYSDAVGKANGSGEAVTKAAEEYAQSLKNLLNTRCGPDPRQSGSDEASQIQRGAIDAGVRAAGVTSARYAMWKERVVPFCNLPAAKRGNGVVRADGYAYLASEAEALAPRCATLMPKISQGS